MTLTATHAQVDQADRAEDTMLAYWRNVLRQPLGTYVPGETPEQRGQRVVHLIEQAIDYEPLLGLPMDVCNRPACHTWVEESARDEHGSLFCSDSCRDDASHAEEERRNAEAMYQLAEPGGWH